LDSTLTGVLPHMRKTGRDNKDRDDGEERAHKGKRFRKRGKQPTATFRRAPTFKAVARALSKRTLSMSDFTDLPAECLPQEGVPRRGKCNYTIYSYNSVGNTECSIQVRLRPKACFYIVKSAKELVCSRTVSWNRFASVQKAWEFAREVTGWQSSS